MSEAVRDLHFQDFRGLPDCDFKLKGKNLVLLGSNGKGKSAIAEGIEFLFSGRVCIQDPSATVG
jgi:recombinational DNA repair ATPase RecF